MNTDLTETSGLALKTLLEYAETVPRVDYNAWATERNHAELYPASLPFPPLPSGTQLLTRGDFNTLVRLPTGEILMGEPEGDGLDGRQHFSPIVTDHGTLFNVEIEDEHGRFEVMMSTLQLAAFVISDRADPYEREYPPTADEAERFPLEP
jgi:hypothetical protein